MKEWAGTLTEWRKIGSSLAGVVCVLTGLLLLAPDDFVDRTGLLELRNDHKPWLGLGFLASLSIFVAGLLEAIAGSARDFFKERRIQKNLRTVLKNLTPQERKFLQPYIADQETTVTASLNDGITASLSAKKIIYRASTISSYDLDFPFNLQPWARKALANDPSLIDL